MNPKRNEVLQGTLVLLILQTLATRGRMHGYAIATHIHQVSDELLRVEEGSLYPALRRMEEAGWLKAKWGLTEKNRQARFYEVSKKGLAELAAEQETWKRLTRGVAKVLNFT